MTKLIHFLLFLACITGLKLMGEEAIIGGVVATVSLLSLSSSKNNSEAE